MAKEHKPVSMNRQDAGADYVQAVEDFRHQSQRRFARFDVGDNDDYVESQYQLEKALGQIENHRFDWSAVEAPAPASLGLAPDVQSPYIFSTSDDEIVLSVDDDLETPVYASLTPPHRLIRSKRQIEGIISLSAESGEAPVLVCWFYDFEMNRIAVEFCHADGMGFILAVPSGAHSVSFGLRVEKACIATIGYLKVNGCMLDESTITVDNMDGFSNDTTRSFMTQYSTLAKMIPDSNGTSYYDSPKLSAGIITDDFMYNYYADALDLHYLDSENYKDVFRNNKIDLVLYVSCWRGMKPADEQGRYEYYPRDAVKIVPEIFDHARKQGIPVIFQTIEDPPSYSLFLPIAKCADVIFTATVEKIPDYVKDTGNPLVFYQPYGVNPLIHNPIGFLKKLVFDQSFHDDSVFFAGSWYSTYPERCADTCRLFDAVVDELGKNLIIADRALEFENRGNRTFPREYNEYIVPAIEHKLLQKVHKLFDFSLNLNSIKDSETMGAMRVYEVQALGGLLISNHALSVENAFPDICMVKNTGDLTRYFEKLTRDEILKRQLLGIRRIFSNATVYDRLNSMFLRAGIDFSFPEKPVYVFYEALTDRIKDSFDAQTCSNKHLMCLNDAVKAWGNPGYAIIFDDEEYSPFLLEDATNAFKYVDVAYIASCDIADYSAGYDYARNTHTRYGTLYDMKKIDHASFMAGCEELPLDGFTVAL